jgi:hypothetical protein
LHIREGLAKGGESLFQTFECRWKTWYMIDAIGGDYGIKNINGTITPELG